MAKMLRLVRLLAGAIVALVRSRTSLVAENLALRQQLAILKGERPRPKLANMDRIFWVALSRVWPGWEHALVVVQPETVVRWHRHGFRLFWRWKSRSSVGGRPRIDRELRALIRRMAFENARWGSPRIHGELLKLGFEVSQSTVARYMPKRPSPPDTLKRWMAFLRNHADGIAAMDFFTVPTATFQVLYVWFAIRHARRDVIHVAVTDHPHAGWVIQQLREAFPFESAPRHLIYDNDSTFRGRVDSAVRSFGTKPARTAYRSPWQNPIAERWIGSCRRELLGDVVVLGQRHLTRLLQSYVAYYRKDRLHLSLDKEAPVPRPISDKPSPDATVISFPRVGGLHHRYEWARSA